MTNNKLKKGKVYTNLIARDFYDCSERNLCAVYLALLSMGVSKAKIHAMDDDFYDNTVNEFRHDAEDDVSDAKFARFLDSVGLTMSDVSRVVNRHKSKIARAFPTTESFALAMQALYSDFCMVLYQCNKFLGFGKTRLLRVIDYVSSYSGDEKIAVYEQLSIRYPDSNSLPDTTDLFKLKRQREKQQEQARKDVVRVMAKTFA